MTPHERKKLERIARTLEESLSFVRELLHDAAPSQDREGAANFDAAGELHRLRSLERTAVEARLGELKQHELGTVFAQAGGPSADRKKPKVWLVEQILWRVFDFERGHEAIRGKGAGET